MSKRWTKTVKILVGRGRMISGTSKTMQQISQMISRAASTSHGMAMPQRLALEVAHGACSWWMRSRSSWTMSTKCGSKVVASVRGRGMSIFLAMHDAAGPAAHHIDGVGEIDRLAQVVRHQHAGEALLQPQRLHDAPQLLAREGVERAERLVEHQQLGLVDQRAAEVRALLHAARELPGILVGEVGEADRLQELHRALDVLGAMAAEAALVRLDHLHAAAGCCSSSCATASGSGSGTPCRRP